MLAVAIVLIAAAGAGTWYELRHDGQMRRPFDPTYNSRQPR